MTDRMAGLLGKQTRRQTAALRAGAPAGPRLPAARAASRHREAEPCAALRPGRPFSGRRTDCQREAACRSTPVPAGGRQTPS